MRKLVLLTLASVLAACSQDTKALEKKIDDNTKELREIKAMIAKGGGGGGGGNARPGREEPAPDAVFAVDVSANVKKGMIEGPSTALVTIVEAWDFA